MNIETAAIVIAFFVGFCIGGIFVVLFLDMMNNRIK